MRRAAKVDANQRFIVEALRAVGASVELLHAVGKGCPDLLIGYQGINYLLEVKDGAKAPSAQKLTEDQVAWHERWRGRCAVVNDVKSALLAIGALRGTIS